MVHPCGINLDSNVDLIKVKSYIHRSLARVLFLFKKPQFHIF